MITCLSFTLCFCQSNFFKVLTNLIKSKLQNQIQLHFFFKKTKDIFKVNKNYQIAFGFNIVQKAGQPLTVLIKI